MITNAQSDKRKTDKTGLDHKRPHQIKNFFMLQSFLHQESGESAHRIRTKYANYITDKALHLEYKKNSYNSIIKNKCN